jgi:hypothetical protein
MPELEWAPQVLAGTRSHYPEFYIVFLLVFFLQSHNVSMKRSIGGGLKSRLQDGII